MRVQRRGVRQITASQHGRSHSVIERRRVDVPAIRVVAHQWLFGPELFGPGLIGPVPVEHFIEFRVEAHGRELFVRRPGLFEPSVGADVKSLARRYLRLSSHKLLPVAHRGELEADNPRLPRVQPVRAAINVFGQRALKARGRNVFQTFERLDLLTQITRGGSRADDLRNELMNELRRVAGDARLGPVEMAPAALARLGAIFNVNERRFASEGFDVRFGADARFEPEAQVGVPVALYQRVAQHQVEQRVRRLVVRETALPSQRFERGPGRVNQPPDVIQIVVGVTADQLGLGKGTVVNYWAAQQVLRSDEEFLQNVRRRFALVEELPDELGSVLGMIGGGPRLAVSFEVQAIEQLLLAFGVALVIFGRTRMQPDDLEQRLIRVARLSDE